MPWKPRLTWKSFLVFVPLGRGRFSNWSISAMARISTSFVIVLKITKFCDLFKALFPYQYLSLSSNDSLLKTSDQKMSFATHNFFSLFHRGWDFFQEKRERTLKIENCATDPKCFFVSSERLVRATSLVSSSAKSVKICYSLHREMNNLVIWKTEWSDLTSSPSIERYPTQTAGAFLLWATL